MNKWRLRRSVETSLSGGSRSCDRCADSVLRVIRRACVFVVALGGLVSLSACSTVDKPAATVNGVEIPMSEFAAEVKALQATELGEKGIGFVLDPSRPQSSSGDATREWLQLRIFETLTDQVVAESGQPLPADQLETARASFVSSKGWDQLPADLQSTILNIVVSGGIEAVATKVTASTSRRRR
jgi:hypothetical protein